MSDPILDAVRKEIEAERLRPHARRPGEDVELRGIGLRRAHLRCTPSFGPGDAYDIRELRGGDLALYHSEVSPRSGWMFEYVRVPIDGEALASALTQLQAIEVPIKPWVSSTSRLDGTSFEVALFGDLSSEVRFTWWEDAPPKWKPLAALAKKLFKEFAAARRVA